MRSSALCFGLLIGSVPLAGWSQSNNNSHPDNYSQEFSRAEWAIINTLSPLPNLPVDTTNKYRDSAAAALLGQELFFEPRLSGPIQTGTPQEGQLGAIGEKYKIACRNCHILRFEVRDRLVFGFLNMERARGLDRNFKACLPGEHGILELIPAPRVCAAPRCIGWF